MEWKYHFMLHTLPTDSRSQNLFTFSAFLTGECQMVEYVCSVTLLQKMSNRVKSHDLPRQRIGPALSTQHCCSSFKSFFISRNHHTWGFHLLTPHKQNPVQSGKQNFTGRTRDFPGLFNIHVSSEHRSHCDSPEMRKIFQLYYGAVNQSPSQKMCQCLATAAIALCLHAVQQCGCKIILRDQM